MVDYAYPLPTAAIAQTPVEPRSSARLLDLTASPWAHRRMADLPVLLGPGDVVVVNETRVEPYRIRARKPTGGAVEIVLLEQGPDGWWDAMTRPSRRLAVGLVVRARSGVECEIGEEVGHGLRRVRLLADDEAAALAAAGEPALPPYVKRPLADPGRYQTVFAERPGSVAAPTAGLHFTKVLLDDCRAAGAAIHAVDLTVGIGTFRPITADDPADHSMHAERYHVPAGVLAACRSAGRVVAVGTTVVRALEAAAATGRLEGLTDLFIKPGYAFAVVDVLVTNFHLPRSTLLLLLEAFAGPRWREAYEAALTAGYRFLSLGDAMVVAKDGLARTS